MDTPKPKEQIVEVEFNNVTSRIFTYLGRVYVRNFNDLKDKHYTLYDSNPEWLVTYIQESDLSNISEKERKNYTGSQCLIRTDQILKDLLGIKAECSNQEYQNIVSKSEKAKAWASGLQKGKNSVDWWFANGCPMENNELSKVVEWQKKEGYSHEIIASKSIAEHILTTRIKLKEMEMSSDPR